MAKQIGRLAISFCVVASSLAGGVATSQASAQPSAQRVQAGVPSKEPNPSAPGAISGYHAEEVGALQEILHAPQYDDVAAYSILSRDYKTLTVQVVSDNDKDANPIPKLRGQLARRAKDVSLDFVDVKNSRKVLKGVNEKFVRSSRGLALGHDVRVAGGISVSGNVVDVEIGDVPGLDRGRVDRIQESPPYGCESCLDLRGVG